MGTRSVAEASHICQNGDVSLLEPAPERTIGGGERCRDLLWSVGRQDSWKASWQLLGVAPDVRSVVRSNRRCEGEQTRVGSHAVSEGDRSACSIGLEKDAALSVFARP